MYIYIYALYQTTQQCRNMKSSTVTVRSQKGWWILDILVTETCSLAKSTNIDVENPWFPKENDLHGGCSTSMSLHRMDFCSGSIAKYHKVCGLGRLGQATTAVPRKCPAAHHPCPGTCDAVPNIVDNYITGHVWKAKRIGFGFMSFISIVHKPS